MFQETVTLVLKHADIDTDPDLATASSEMGHWSNGKQKTTFRLNLKRLLGELYDMHNMFVLRLNQLSHSSADFPAANNLDQNVIVQLSGLSFVNSTYDPRTGNNSGKYNMVIATLEKNVSRTINYAPNISMCNFVKSAEYVDLTIDLIRVQDGLPAEHGTEDLFPHMAYSFDIYAID